MKNRIHICQIDERTDAWLDGLRELFACQLPPEALDGQMSRFKSMGERVHCHAGAYDGERLVGFGTLLKSNKSGRWFLDALFVHPEYRNQGIAGGLTDCRIDWLKKNNIEEVWYLCADSNVASVKSHRQYNFERMQEASNEESPVPAHWYRLQLKT